MKLTLIFLLAFGYILLNVISGTNRSSGREVKKSLEKSSRNLGRASNKKERTSSSSPAKLRLKSSEQRKRRETDYEDRKPSKSGRRRESGERYSSKIQEIKGEYRRRASSGTRRKSDWRPKERVERKKSSDGRRKLAISDPSGKTLLDKSRERRKSQTHVSSQRLSSTSRRKEDGLRRRASSTFDSKEGGRRKSGSGRKSTTTRKRSPSLRRISTKNSRGRSQTRSSSKMKTTISGENRSSRKRSKTPSMASSRSESSKPKSSNSLMSTDKTSKSGNSERRKESRQHSESRRHYQGSSSVFSPSSYKRYSASQNKSTSRSSGHSFLSYFRTRSSSRIGGTKSTAGDTAYDQVVSLEDKVYDIVIPPEKLVTFISLIHLFLTRQQIVPPFSEEMLMTKMQKKERADFLKVLDIMALTTEQKSGLCSIFNSIESAAKINEKAKSMLSFWTLATVLFCTMDTLKSNGQNIDAFLEDFERIYKNELALAEKALDIDMAIAQIGDRSMAETLSMVQADITNSMNHSFGKSFVSKSRSKTVTISRDGYAQSTYASQSRTAGVTSTGTRSASQSRLERSGSDYLSTNVSSGSRKSSRGRERKRTTRQSQSCQSQQCGNSSCNSKYGRISSRSKSNGRSHRMGKR